MPDATSYSKKRRQSVVDSHVHFVASMYDEALRNIGVHSQLMLAVDHRLNASRCPDQGRDSFSCGGRIRQSSHSWLAVLKSSRPSCTRATMVFSPSRTQTRGSKYFLFGLSSPSGLPIGLIR